MIILSRTYDLLRSRRLAAVLLLAVAAWSGAATVVPQNDRSGAETLPGVAGPLVEVLGLDHAFSAPLFIGMAMLLFCSIVACSLERTRSALRLWRHSRTGASRVEAARKRRDLVIEIYGGVDAHAVGDALHGAGLRVRHASDTSVFATSPRIGIWGSPAFHWMLALLIAVIAAGQLTRSEGLMGIPVGSWRQDVEDSYGVVSEGLLHSRFTMLTIAVPSLQLTHVVDGIDRGPAPFVELYDGPERLASQHVYPNHPLRYRSLMIHADGYGLAVALIASDGTSIDALLDFDEKRCVALSANVLEIVGPSGVTRIDLSIPLDRVRGGCVPALPREQRIDWVATGATGNRSGTVRPGERFEPFPGFALTVADVGYYSRLSVVDDWSVYPMYAVFVLAVLALTVALFAPYREAAVLIERGAETTVLRVRVRQARKDLGFERRVQGSIGRALCASGDPSMRRSDDDD